MIGLAPASSMTTQVQYHYPEAETAATASAREQFSGAFVVDSDWVIVPVSRIFQLEQLPPNWDGYGSKAPSKNLCVRALALIGQLARFANDDLPPPHIAPGSGALVFEFTVGRRELTLALNEEDARVIRYVRSESGEPFDEGPVGPGRLSALVSWLLMSSPL